MAAVFPFSLAVYILYTTRIYHHRCSDNPSVLACVRNFGDHHARCCESYCKDGSQQRNSLRRFVFPRSQRQPRKHFLLGANRPALRSWHGLFLVASESNRPGGRTNNSAVREELRLSVHSNLPRLSTDAPFSMEAALLTLKPSPARLVSDMAGFLMQEPVTIGAKTIVLYRRNGSSGQNDSMGHKTRNQEIRRVDKTAASS